MTNEPTNQRTIVATLLHNQFRVTRSIGRALYGDVWLCQDTHSDNQQQQLVAIKQVSLCSAKRALSLNRHVDNPFDERRITSYLASIPTRHANILHVRQEFLENGAWHLVTDYCDGGDLLQQFKTAPDTRFRESHALHLFQQIVQGVHFLHTHGIAHGDLSLENVLLHDGVAKICDFGLATDANRICRERVGKAYYMAPEVVVAEHQQHHYDPVAADLWSLGIVLFILLTGSPLTPSASRNEKAFLALETFGVSKILESRISRGTVDLLAGLLQTEPATRLRASQVLQHVVFQQA